MKNFRICALLLAVLMLSACFVGCAKEKTYVNVKVSVVANGETIFGPVDAKVETDPETPATILYVVSDAFDQNEFEYEADDMSFLSINGLSYKEEDGNTYFWDFTINGETPDEGRASTIIANEGDEIVYTYYAESTEDLAANEDAGEN